jgi:phosphoribosylamine--glycine ligase
MDQFTVMIVGSGGREHALAWKVAQSSRVMRVIVAPGNAGTAASNLSTSFTSKISNTDIRAEDIADLLQFAQDYQIGLTIVGPEVPLAEGIVDSFTTAGLRIFGPSRAAAQLEASKAYAKRFMYENHMPTAEYASFDDFDKASAWVRAFGRPVVVKSDGLAAGKGVIMCETADDAIIALRRCMLDREFGAASTTVVVEERLTGREVSVLAFCDGSSVLTMPTARDHKRAYDNDEGPNTGGMGAYAPAPDVSAALIDEIKRTVLQPAVNGMAARGIPYKGVLYAGIMLTPNGPRTLEFNCRFGDPETQVILPLLQSDLVDILLACTDGTLDNISSSVHWNEGACATVVAAAPGYPSAYPKGIPIAGLENNIGQSGSIVFHAGTAMKDGRIVTSGGRVLSVSACGDDMHAALDRAYAGMNHIQFEGMHYRKDIGVLR